MRKSLLAAVVAPFIVASAAVAQEAPKVAFDATYKQSGPQGTSMVRMASDGKGKMLTESNAGGQKMLMISDYPNRVAYTVMQAQKMVMKMPLPVGKDVHDSESAKKAGAKDLGSKVIAGHPCHGWEYTTSSGKTTVWVGDDINYMVKSESSGNGYNVSTELVSFSKSAPGADAFAVPTGYKVMDTAHMGH